MLLLLALLGLFQAVSCDKVDLEKPKGLARGRVETCGGWQLSVLTEVKAFVQEDLPLYHNLVLKYIPGANPELLLLNYSFEELDRVNLMPMTRKEINELLLRLGFYKKESPNAQVPNNFYYAPMLSKPVEQFDSPVGKPFQEDETEELDESDGMKQDL